MANPVFFATLPPGPEAKCADLQAAIRDFPGLRCFRGHLRASASWPVNTVPLTFLNVCELGSVQRMEPPCDGCSRLSARRDRRHGDRIRPHRRGAVAGHRRRRRDRGQCAACISGATTTAGWCRRSSSRLASPGGQLAAGSPNILASDTAAEPGFSGFCCDASGAHPDSQTIENVALMRPSGSEKRSRIDFRGAREEAARRRPARAGDQRIGRAHGAKIRHQIETARRSGPSASRHRRRAARSLPAAAGRRRRGRRRRGSRAGWRRQAFPSPPPSRLSRNSASVPAPAMAARKSPSGRSARRIWISMPGMSFSSCSDSSDTARSMLAASSGTCPGRAEMPGSPARNAASASTRTASSSLAGGEQRVPGGSGDAKQRRGASRISRSTVAAARRDPRRRAPSGSRRPARREARRGACARSAAPSSTIRCICGRVLLPALAGNRVPLLLFCRASPQGAWPDGRVEKPGARRARTAGKAAVPAGLRRLPAAGFRARRAVRRLLVEASLPGKALVRGDGHAVRA